MIEGELLVARSFTHILKYFHSSFQPTPSFFPPILSAISSSTWPHHPFTIIFSLISCSFLIKLLLTRFSWKKHHRIERLILYFPLHFKINFTYLICTEDESPMGLLLFPLTSSLSTCTEKGMNVRCYRGTYWKSSQDICAILWNPIPIHVPPLSIYLSIYLSYYLSLLLRLYVFMYIRLSVQIHVFICL